MIRRWDSDIEIVSIFLFVIICVVFLFLIVGGIVNYTTFSSKIAEVEQVRAAMQKVGCNLSVQDRAVEINIKIAQWQVANKRFLIGIAIPNDWEQVELIEMPVCKKGQFR